MTEITCESDNFIVDYFEDEHTYRVSYFEDGHYVDEVWFDGVRHAHWNQAHDSFGNPIKSCICSNCGRRVRNKGENYCPRCGRMMKG